MKPHRGTTILILGILSLFCYGIILGPIAFFMGTSDIKQMQEGQMDPSGMGITNAGRFIGLAGALLWIVGLVLQLTGTIHVYEFKQ
jgi:hypothetical protein